MPCFTFPQFRSSWSLATFEDSLILPNVQTKALLSPKRQKKLAERDTLCSDKESPRPDSLKPNSISRNPPSLYAYALIGALLQGWRLISYLMLLSSRVNIIKQAPLLCGLEATVHRPGFSLDRPARPTFPWFYSREISDSYVINGLKTLVWKFLCKGTSWPTAPRNTVSAMGSWSDDFRDALIKSPRSVCEPRPSWSHYIINSCFFPPTSFAALRVKKCWRWLIVTWHP